MTIIAEFRFPLPPCLNEQINMARNNRYGSAKEKEKWTNDIAALALEQTKHRFQGRVWMQFIYYLKNSRRDPDNVSASRKYILDGLVQAGIIINDNLQIIQSPIVESFVVSQSGKGKDKIKILTDEVVVRICDEPLGIVGKNQTLAFLRNLVEV